MMKLLDFFGKKEQCDDRESGQVCEHLSTHTVSYDYGEQSYSSYGGGVESLVIHVEKCDRCGRALSGYATGDFCGTDEELQNMIDELIRNENR